MSKLPEPTAWMLDGGATIEMGREEYHSGAEWEPLYSETQVKELLAKADASRIAAQIENEELKGRIARSGLDARLRYEPVLKIALDSLDQSCGDRCNAEYNPCHAREAADAIRKVLP